MTLAHQLPNLQPAFLARSNLNLYYPHPCYLLIQQSHPPPSLQLALLALEPTSTILFTHMPLAHAPPNVQPTLLALQPTSTFLSTLMPHAHPPPILQPTLLALEPTLNILATPIPIANLSPNLHLLF